MNESNDYDVTALRELVAKVPQGEYTREDGAFAYVMMPDGDALMLEPEDKTRADYICAALNALPGLLDRLEALEKALRQTDELLNDPATQAPFQLAHIHNWHPTPEWVNRAHEAKIAREALLASPTSHRSASGGAPSSNGEDVP